MSSQPIASSLVFCLCTSQIERSHVNREQKGRAGKNTVDTECRGKERHTYTPPTTIIVPAACTRPQTRQQPGSSHVVSGVANQRALTCKKQRVHTTYQQHSTNPHTHTHTHTHTRARVEHRSKTRQHPNSDTVVTRQKTKPTTTKKQ